MRRAVAVARFVEAHSSVGKEGRQARDSNASSDGRPGATEVRESVDLATPSFGQIGKAVDISICTPKYTAIGRVEFHQEAAGLASRPS